MRNSKPSALTLVLCLFLLYLSWGGSFIGIKIVLQSIPPGLQSGLRMTMAGGIMLTFLLFTKRINWPGWRNLGAYFLLAFLSMFLNNFLQGLGQQSLPSGITAMLYGTIPLWMVLSGWLLMGETKPSIAQFLGMGGATLGLYLLTLGQAGESGSLWNRGTLFILGGILSFVAGSLVSKLVLQRSGLPVYTVSAILLFLGGIQGLIASCLMGEQLDIAHVLPQAWAALAFLTVFTAIIGNLCYYWLLVNAKTIVAVSFAYIDPVLAVALGYFLGGEDINLNIVIACALIVLSVLCSLMPVPRRAA